MKLGRIAFLTLVLFTLSLSQSLQDIEKLKALQKQLESSAGQIEKRTIKSEEVKSLETFPDTLSSIPTEQLKAIKVKSVEDIEKEKKSFATPDKAFKTLKPFGYDIFAKAKLELKPSLFGPVPSDYPLGPGDEVIITLWGEVELRHSLIIDRNGQIMIPDVGLVNLAGLSLQRAKKKLFNVLKNYYSGLKHDKITLEVALGKLRSIKVFVTGEVNQPGVFTVPAYLSPFAMLFYAGGVTTKGSLREIIILRNNKRIADVDFYAFLTGKELEKRVQLQNRDIIVIPRAENRVYLAGAVGRPAVYEFKKGETLQQLLQFAGKPLPNAYLEQIEIQRYLPYQKPVYLNINFLELRKKNEKFLLMNDDHIFVYPIDKERENYVIIDGPVYGPKRFAYHKGMTVRQLFSKVDSIKGDAYLERAIVSRRLPDNRKESFAINLKCILENSCADFVLQQRDSIIFKSIYELFPVDSVSIHGAVNEPGKYQFSKDMSLMDLIYLAGGFAVNANLDSVEISRPVFSEQNNSVIAKIFNISVDTSYGIGHNPEAEKFMLQPYDAVHVYVNSNWELQRYVTINGEVFRPGTYSLVTKKDKLSDLIRRAGGLKPTAYIKGARFIREKDNTGQIGIDFAKAIKEPSSDENIILEDGDLITIPERRYTVKIMGGVNFPSAVLYDPDMDLDDYIDAAGGLTELADKDNISVMLANGKRVKEKTYLLFFSSLPENITPGSVIYVPTLAEAEKTDWSGAIRDAAAILASVATVILIIDQINR